MSIKRTLLWLLILAASCTTLSFCGKIPSSSYSSPIKISALSCNNSTETKTSYGEDFTMADGLWQRIDWTPGDIITIWSDYAILYDPVADTPVDPVQHGQDFTVTSSITPNDKESLATLELTEKTLRWVDGQDSYKFWGIYPANAQNPNASVVSGNKMQAVFPAHQQKSGESSVTTGDVTRTILSPDMDYAYMMAYVGNVPKGEENMVIPFYPAFTAFEITLRAAENDFPMTKVTLTSASKKMCGTATMTIPESNYGSAGAGDIVLDAQPTDGGNSVEFDLTGYTVEPKSEVTCTIFALPQDYNDLTITITTANNIVKSIPLKYISTVNGGAYVNFPARHKHRISGLAIPGGNWQFSVNVGLDPQVMEWNLIEATSFVTDYIQATALKVIDGCLENPDDNHYDDPVTRKYQIRTMDMTVAEPYMTVTFTPTAPLGGYWMLSPQLESDLFRVVIWNDADYQDDPYNYTGNPKLTGHIMNQQVTLRIYAKVSPSTDRTITHQMFLKGWFSSTADFSDKVFSADSELQDAHSDGTFSYFLFVIPAQ